MNRGKTAAGDARAAEGDVMSGRLDLPAYLDDARQTGPDSWSARCAAHEDRDPSLSARDTGDKWLVYCHAGCSADQIVATLGLTMADLYHDRGRMTGTERREYAQAANKRTLAAVLRHEALIIHLALSDRERNGNTEVDAARLDNSTEDWQRERLAARRLVRVIPAYYGVGVAP